MNIRTIPGITGTDIAATSKSNRKTVLPDKEEVKKTLLPNDKEDRRNVLIAAGGLAALGAIGAAIVYRAFK